MGVHGHVRCVRNYERCCQRRRHCDGVPVSALRRLEAMSTLQFAIRRPAWRTSARPHIVLFTCRMHTTSSTRGEEVTLMVVFVAPSPTCILAATPQARACATREAEATSTKYAGEGNVPLVHNKAAQHGHQPTRKLLCMRWSRVLT